MTERKKMAEIRRGVADLLRNAGCGCCGDRERRDEAEDRLGRILRVPRYADGSGHDFSRYESKTDA